MGVPASSTAAEILRYDRSDHGKDANAGRDPRRGDLRAHEWNLVQLAGSLSALPAPCRVVLGLVAGERLGPRAARRFAATNLAIGSKATVSWTMDCGSCLGGTFEVSPHSAGCSLRCRLTVPAAAGHGLMEPEICGHWLPVRLPGISLATVMFECPEPIPTVGSRRIQNACSPVGPIQGCVARVSSGLGGWLAVLMVCPSWSAVAVCRGLSER